MDLEGKERGEQIAQEASTVGCLGSCSLFVSYCIPVSLYVSGGRSVCVQPKNSVSTAFLSLFPREPQHKVCPLLGFEHVPLTPLKFGLGT